MRGVMRGSWIGVVVAFATSWVLLGCQQTAPPPPPPPDTGSEFTEAPVEEEIVEVVETVVELQTVYFDFDSYEIRPDARPMLRGNAEAISAISGVVTIEGHTDERGSEEYNLALGERRATAAKRYLVDLGVPSSRLRTVSFGEDRPAVAGHTESAWRYNRRADFVME